MKKIFLILCVILPFFLFCPLNASAFYVQGTEYEDPGLLPPDIDFSQYDYYFLAFSGTAENPTYLLYLINDNSDEKQNRIYFSVSLQPSSTKIYDSEYTSYGITSNYSITVKTYNNSTGSWGSLKNALTGFVFDSYSEFTSSYKYIIGSNANIYSYSGSLLRSGDYDDLNLFFLGGLYNSSEVTENPSSETTTSDSGSSGNDGINIDFSFLSDYFDKIIDSFGDFADKISDIIEIFSSLSDSFNVSSEKDYSSILEELKQLLSNSITNNAENLKMLSSSINEKLDEIKQEIINFERYFSEFSAIDGNIANIFSVLSGLNSNIVNIHVRLMEIKEIIDGISGNISDLFVDFHNFYLNFPTDFGDIINSINDYLVSLRTDFHNFFVNFPTDFGDIINSINGHLANLRTDFHNFFLNFSIDSFFKDLNLSVDSLFNDLKLSLDDIFSDISLKIDSLDTSKIINAINDVKTAVSNLPEDFKDLLIKLFVPKTEKPTELMNMIKEHFEFVEYFADLSDKIFNSDNFSNKAPDYTIEINSDLFGHFEGNIIDFSVIPYDYVYWFRCLTSGIATYFFIQKIRKRLPVIINGGAES